MRRLAMRCGWPVFLVAAFAGCRGGLSFRAVPPAADSPLVAEIAERLISGRWERSPTFDLLAFESAERRRAADFRWQFVSGEAVAGPGAPSPAAEPIAEPDADPPPDAGPSDAPGPAPPDDARRGEAAVAAWTGASAIDLDALLARIDRETPNDDSRAASGDDLPHALSPSDRVLRELADRNEAAGWNAAIVLARRSPERAGDLLGLLHDLTTGAAGASRDDPASPALRAAAAEAWCRALAASERDPIDGLAPAGRMLQEPRLDPAVREELFRSVAAHAPPARIPLLSEALDETAATSRAPVELRRAAVEACLIHALLHSPAGAGKSVSASETESEPPSDERWPSTLANCQWDRDAVVRRLYGRWLAVTKPPRAFRILQAQISDRDLAVRDAALDGLGVLGTSEAISELDRQAGRAEELVRAAAVRGIARLGPERLVRHANDPSAAVRKAVAAGLARHPGPRSAIVLRELVADGNVQVQGTAVEAISHWPDRLAIPVLLRSLEESSALVRHESFRDLRRRRRIDEPYRPDGSLEDRRAAIARIVRQAGLPAGVLDELRHDGLAATTPESDRRRSGRIEAWLLELDRFPPTSPEHAAARENLSRLEPADVAVVERIALDGNAAASRIVFDEILPAISPPHAALRDLSSPDVFVRRRGSQRLAEAAGEASLSPLVLRRLREALSREQDRLTWRFGMEAVSPDASDEGAQIALLALNHVWPDVRQLGCEHVSRHPSAEAALWLRPLLDDPDHNVRRAAIEAAGRCGNPAVIEDFRGPDADGEPTRGLRSLLRDGDRHIRFAAGCALSRLGDTEGAQEMVRLLHDDSPARRIEVVRAMADTGRTRFREPLVETGWTERNDRVRRAILEALDRLTPPEQRPKELAAARDDDERIAAWSRTMSAGSSTHRGRESNRSAGRTDS